MLEYLMPYIVCGLLLISVINLVLLITKKRDGNTELIRRIEQLRNDMLRDAMASRQESLGGTQSSIKALGELLSHNQERSAASQDARIAELSSQLAMRQETLQNTVTEMMKRVDSRIDAGEARSEAKLEAMRINMEKSLCEIKDDNGKKLEAMRATVDEKLEKTLQERLGQSFKLVSERLEQVYKGLGEMQTVAAGVSDLKKVLSNVKTRGVLGEVQLGAILEEILSPGQYEANVATKKGSTCVVEYAVKMPGDGSGSVYLPVDAKFPADAYEQLCDAYDAGNTAAIEAAGTALERRIKLFAKEICDKYIDPPYTTDFAVMFLPFEGLYAEAARRGLFESLQREYKITVTGPTTMAAFLNSLQMGFRTLAVQKRSGEVWQVLGAVKTEFEKFGGVLSSAQQKLTQASTELDKLVGVRTRQIQRRLLTLGGSDEEQQLLSETYSSEDQRV